MKKHFIFPLMLIGLIRHADVSAQAMPILKNGTCPSGYSHSGQYCVPRAQAGFAIEKKGSYPSGYSQSGNYCVARKAVGRAIPKQGTCPSGFNSSGKYCVER